MGKRTSSKKKSPEELDEEMLTLIAQAEAISVLGSLPRIEPVIVRFREPGPVSEDGMPIDVGGIVCDTRRYVARSSSGSLTFDRGENESLEEFEKRVECALGDDGRFWLAIPELLQNSLHHFEAIE